jgi:hypothetical protein
MNLRWLKFDLTLGFSPKDKEKLVLLRAYFQVKRSSNPEHFTYHQGYATPGYHLFILLNQFNYCPLYPTFRCIYVGSRLYLKPSQKLIRLLRPTSI